MSEKNSIPASIFPVPSNQIGYELAARHIFTIVAPSHRLFRRGRVVHEVIADAEGERLEPITTERFCAMIETFGRRVARAEISQSGSLSWRPATFPANSARVVMATDAACDLLPPIRQLLACPILTPDGQLGAGYHEAAGGTLVLSTKSVDSLPVDFAVQSLLDLLADFDFPSASDAARAVASLVSPALKAGGWIDDDFPLDLAEADQSQSGKTYRQKLVCAIYNETPSTITPTKGGVGSVDEAIQSAMIRGRMFINLGNFRGRLDSPVMEEALRGNRFIHCRALRNSATVDASGFLWQLSTNGAELTRDMANRCVVTRIRKRSDRHVYKTYPEGDLLAHVRRLQGFYLGCVFSVIEEWARHGTPRTSEHRHDFKTWCQSLDWIVQNIFKLPPLLDGHREEQLRTANPALQWLRDVINAVLQGEYKGHGMSAQDLAETSDEHDIQIPGRVHGTPADMKVGMMLGKLFREAQGSTITVDGRRFTRQLDSEYDAVNRKHRDRKTYFIETT